MEPNWREIRMLDDPEIRERLAKRIAEPAPNLWQPERDRIPVTLVNWQTRLMERRYV